MTQQTPLYEVEIDDKTIFAHYLATNSKGMWVMEDRATKEMFVVAPDKAQEVLPYTVSVRYMDANSRAAKAYHFFAREGDWKKDDLVYEHASLSMVRVIAVDTKSKAATRWLKGWKISAEFIDAPET